jgi:hypothetical protein
MATHLAKLLLSRGGDLSEDDSAKIESMIEDVRAVAAKHGYSLGDYEHWGLPSEHYEIGPCSRCKSLTFDEGSAPDREIIDQFRLILRPGRKSGTMLFCTECQERLSAR